MPLSPRHALPAIFVALLFALPACKKDSADPPSSAPPSPDAGPTPAAPQNAPVLPGASGSADPRQRHEEEVAMHFADTDKDHDGKVTLEETRAVADARFAEVDKNKDGSLDADELTAVAEQEFARAATARIRSLDKNGDGKLTRDEAAPGMLAHFEKYDTDGDGAISLDEVMKLTAPRSGRPRQSPLAALDTDGDGIVSMQEHGKARADWFERADSNHDGAVTLEEAKAAVPKGRGAPGAMPGNPGQ